MMIYMSVEISIITILGIFYFALAAAVFLRDKKSKVNIFFALFSLCTSLFTIVVFFENKPNIVGEEWIGFFLRLDFITALFLFMLLYYFSVYFTNIIPKKKIIKILQTVMLILAIVNIPLVFLTDLILTNISFTEVINFDDGLLWPLYAATLLFYVVRAAYLLLKKRRYFKKKKELLNLRQINLIIIGAFITFTITLVIFLFLQALFEVNLAMTQLASYSIVFLVGFAGYAVIRYRFFNVRLIIVRSIASMLLVGVLSLLYTGVFIVSVTSILGKTVESGVIFINIILGLIVALSFYPLFRRVMKVTDKIFYKSIYNIKEVFSKISDVVLDAIDLDISYDKVLAILVEEMKISWVACVDVDEGVVVQTRYAGKSKQNLMEIKDELEKIIKYSSEKQYFYNDLPEGKTKEFFHQLGIVVFIPVWVEGRLVSVFLLGEKRSGEMYTKEDKGVFEVMASNVGNIVQKTRAYESIKKSNAELETSKKHIEKLVENLTVGIIEYDDHFTVLRINSSAEKTLGVKRDDILGKTIIQKDIQKTDIDSLARVLYSSLSKKTKHLFSDDAITGVQHNEIIIEHPLERELEVITFFIKEGASKKQTRFVKMIRDVTKEKEIDRNKSEFISIAAHQLRTPISGIRWATQLLLETAEPKLSKDEKVTLNDIERAGSNLARVVRDLLSVARIEERGGWVEKKENSIIELIQKLFHTNEMAAKNKKLHFEFKNETPEMKPIVFDRQNVSIALQSVINNAIDYTEKGEIVITLKEQKDNVLIEVRDTGIGISEEGKEGLFTKFHRTEESKKVETDRSGLGLYLTKQIIEKHGGIVHIRSTQGKGTTVGILLPK